MGPIAIFGIVLFAAIILYLGWFGIGSGDSGRYDIVKGSQRGEVRRSDTALLPRSYNQPQGLTYSYSGWLLVKNFTAGYGTRRRIFSRDDAPGLYLDSTSNSLMFTIDTFGTMETILVPNIPAQKWIHFAIVVDQHSVDIYINGMLRQHQTLNQLPKQNENAVAMGGDWDGVIARLSYWNRSLTPATVKDLAADPIPDDLDRRPSGPQYFDITWYVGRLNSV